VRDHHLGRPRIGDVSQAFCLLVSFNFAGSRPGTGAGPRLAGGPCRVAMRATRQTRAGGGCSGAGAGELLTVV